MDMSVLPDQRQLEYYQRNPVVFMERFLGTNLWQKQQDIADALVTNKTVAVRSCHGSGKTFLAARLALWWLFTRPFSAVLTTAPSNRQVVELLWKEIRVAYANARVNLGGNLLPKAPKLQVDNDWICLGFSTDDPVNFQGWHSRGGTLVIFDEAPGVHPTIWEAVGGVLVSSEDRHLCIGNPVDPSGKFYDLFKRSDVAQIHISAFDTPNVTSGKNMVKGLCSKDWVEEKRKSWGEGTALWSSRVLGDFPELADNILVPIPWLVEANERWKKYEKEGVWKSSSVHIGVDVARLGSDFTILSKYVEGVGIKSVEQLGKQDTMATVGEVVNLASSEKVISINVDADGLGAGVFDRLVELTEASGAVEKPVLTTGVPDSSIKPRGYTDFRSDVPLIRSFRGGMRANLSDRFLNSRAEGYWGLREALDPKGENPIALPVNDKLFNQLSSIRWKLNSRGQIQIEGKDEMRKRGMQSPDEADAVVYSMSGETRYIDFVLV